MSERPPFGHELTRTIIGGFSDVYNELGFGMLESVYAARCAGSSWREVFSSTASSGQPTESLTRAATAKSAGVSPRRPTT